MTSAPILLLADEDVISKALPPSKLSALIETALPLVKASPINEATPAPLCVVASVVKTAAGPVLIRW